MKIRMLAGVACAALTILAAPVSAASPELPAQSSISNASADQAVSNFYASRRSAPLWLRSGADSSAARELIGALQRAPLDGLASGPALAAEAQALMARAQSGDPAALGQAERLLSTAWVLYARTLQTPPAGMVYEDSWVAPRRDTPGQILARAAAAPSLAAYVRSVSQVNPIYAQLRDAAWTQMQANGGQVDPRVLASLDRARDMPFQKRYVMVDTAGAELYMIEDGRIAGSMKVIVGKSDPSTQTPMLASTIYYATLNPYWHVSPGPDPFADREKRSGSGHRLSEVEGLSGASPTGELLDPAKVDWHAVAAAARRSRCASFPGPRTRWAG